MGYLKLAIILLLFVQSMNSDCSISQYMVTNTNRIFTYKDAGGNYQLLRTDTVPSGMTLHMFCQPNNVLETQCQDNGQFTVSLPMSCDNPMKAEVKKISDSACPAQLYAIGHWIGGKHLELYRSCYDARNGRVLYGESDVYYKPYFNRHPIVEFLTDQIVTPAEATAYMKSNIFQVFNSIFGTGQAYLPDSRTLVINRGHMVASADFLFVDQMVSTFRYINVVPQMRAINDGNWHIIEEWLRNQVSRTSPFRIKTGAINVLTLLDQNGRYQCACLSGSKVPVPEWTYKVVRDVHGKGIYVFLTFNCVFLQQKPHPLPICKTVNCPLYLKDNKEMGHTYCCDPSNFPY